MHCMETMNVAVCDDDAVFREMLVCEIKSYSEHNSVEMNIASFSSGLELMISETEYNLIFLDYKMGIMNGLETAKKLRNKGVKCPIIFVTSYNEIVYDVFEVNAFRFITKPVESEVLRKALDDVVELCRNRTTLTFEYGGEAVSIMSDEITYISGMLNGCMIHTVYGNQRSKQSLGAVVKQLPADSFFKCSLNCVVGFKYVKNYDYKSVALKGGYRLKLDRTRSAEFAEAYDAYTQHYGMGVNGINK